MAGPLDQRRCVLMGNHHPFGFASGAGGVDEICQVVRLHRAGNMASLLKGEYGGGDADRLDRKGEVLVKSYPYTITKALLSKHNGKLCILKRPGQTCLWVGRIERDVGPSCFENGQ